MKLVHYLHTALVVSDLTKSEHFYGTVLGLTKVDRALKFPGSWYQLGAIQIHLIQADPASPPASTLGTTQAALNPKWGRNRHIALAVADLGAAKAHLQAHHCPVQLSASGRSALFTQDPDGNIIELS